MVFMVIIVMGTNRLDIYIYTYIHTYIHTYIYFSSVEGSHGFTPFVSPTDWLHIQSQVIASRTQSHWITWGEASYILNVSHLPSIYPSFVSI